jgi:hypothetical protein
MPRRSTMSASEACSILPGCADLADHLWASRHGMLQAMMHGAIRPITLLVCSPAIHPESPQPKTKSCTRLLYRSDSKREIVLSMISQTPSSCQVHVIDLREHGNSVNAVDEKTRQEQSLDQKHLPIVQRNY